MNSLFYSLMGGGGELSRRALVGDESPSGMFQNALVLEWWLRDPFREGAQFKWSWIYVKKTVASKNVAGLSSTINATKTFNCMNLRSARAGAEASAKERKNSFDGIAAVR